MLLGMTYRKHNMVCKFVINVYFNLFRKARYCVNSLHRWEILKENSSSTRVEQHF
jgi:hypothetical protein